MATHKDHKPPKGMPPKGMPKGLKMPMHEQAHAKKKGKK